VAKVIATNRSSVVALGKERYPSTSGASPGSWRKLLLSPATGEVELR
jgi:hypothetical protein